MEAMDFMDPKRRRQHQTMLFIGYGLIAIVILLLTIILIFVAYGFGLKNGQVIQNGLVFLSSTPSSAHIYIDGAKYQSDTNTRIVLPSGDYRFILTRAGYRDWEREIEVDGGAVESFPYPFLIPTSLTTNTKQTYASLPELVTQSPDRRWLVVGEPGNLASFDVYDLNNPTLAPTTISVSPSLFASTSGTLQVIDWSDDNAHVLLRHDFGGTTEYVLLDRNVPAQSVNLSKTFNLPATGIDLRLSNKNFDQYYVYNTSTQVLYRANLSTPELQLVLNNVLAFTTYSDSTILYATPDPTYAKKVAIDLLNDGSTYLIRHVAAGTTYLLDLTTYSGDLYVGISASSENAAFVYKNPIDQITNQSVGTAIPIEALRIKTPSYVAFSATAQYVAFESGSQLAVYDVENDQGYTYSVHDVLDTPQTHMTWMDGARLMYVSHGQVVIVDYDGQNSQVLVSADPQFPLMFDSSYKFLYAAVPSAADKTQELLTNTSLRTPADQ